MKEKSGLIRRPQGLQIQRQRMCQARSTKNKEKCQQRGKQPVLRDSRKQPLQIHPEQSERCRVQKTNDTRSLQGRRQQEPRPPSQAGAQGSMWNQAFKKFFCQSLLSFPHTEKQHVYTYFCLFYIMLFWKVLQMHKVTE